MATAAFGGQSQQRWGDNTLNTNEAMRDFLLADLSGKPCMTSDARKKGMLVLAFFTTDDAQSVSLLKAMQQMADGYGASGKVTVWAVSESGDTQTRAFVETNGIKFPILTDRDGYHQMLYGITSLPTVYLADGKGTIQRKSRGYRIDTLNDISTRLAAFAEIETPVVIA